MIVQDLDIKSYHSDTRSVSKTGLDDIEHSPAYFFGNHLDPNRPPRPKETAAQLVGNMAHCAILEPAKFHDRYRVGPSVNKNTKVWKEFCETLPAGCSAIDEEDYEKAMSMGRSALLLPDFAAALQNGAPEESAYWVDPETGVMCRCRPDWRYSPSPGQVVLFDVKTYKDASEFEFARQVARMRYDVQDAFYTDGYAAATKDQPSPCEVLGFVFIAIETEYPYQANAFMLDEESREAGRAKYRRNLATYAACMRDNRWPGYGDAIKVISMPAWAKE